MNRLALEKLKVWKDKTNRKPLIINGARQVGKTWLMKEFGRLNYQHVTYINFESSEVLKDLFNQDFNIPRIITAIEIETEIPVEEGTTLIVLDEIQEANRGITALKYFHENAPQYHVIAAGSLLGVSLHPNTSFPVGKVDFLDLYPLSFSEYLMALKQHKLLQLLKSNDWSLIKSFKSKFIELLKQYFYVGGMPEVVASFAGNRDFYEVREIQNNILRAYERDFSKHAPNDIVPRIKMLWDALPTQLAKENKKFIYSAVKKGARAKDFELALSWLSDAGLVYKIGRISKPNIPLNAYEDLGAFKLFCVDVGLLTAMGNIDAKTLLQGNAIFQEFKGAITEQFVLQELVPNDNLRIFYWTASKGMAKVDFVVQLNNKVIPIEVKAAENLQSKSLKSYYTRYPETKAVRTSMSDYREEDWLINLPLYAVGLALGFRNDSV